MKVSNLNTGILILMSVFLLNCKKKETPPPPPEPEIEFISITPSEVTEFKDTIIILVKYKDVNGDFGDLDPDDLSLQIKDARIPKADWYHIKPLAPLTGEDINIEGQFRIRLNSLFLMGTGTKELTTLTLKAKDRAGNWSNEIVSPQITINK